MVDANEIIESLPKGEKPNIGSVYDDIKERISNPFLFSYGISFLFTNWKVWVGLLFFDSEKLSQLGCRNHVEYISYVANITTVVCWPLFASLVYTFAFPWFRNFVRWVHAKSITASNRSLNKAAGDYLIEAKEFVRLEEGLEAEKKRYVSAINVRDKLEAEISTKNIQIRELNNRNTETNEQVSTLNNKVKELNDLISTSNEVVREAQIRYKLWEERNSEEYLNGLWQVTGSIPNKFSVEVIIKDLKVYIHDSSSDGPFGEVLFEIENLATNLSDKTMIWVNQTSSGERNIFGFAVGKFAVFTFVDSGYFEYNSEDGLFHSTWTKLKHLQSMAKIDATSRS